MKRIAIFFKDLFKLIYHACIFVIIYYVILFSILSIVGIYSSDFSLLQYFYLKTKNEYCQIIYAIFIISFLFPLTDVILVKFIKGSENERT